MDEEKVQDLVERYRLQGDQTAFRALFDFYSRNVWAIILGRPIGKEVAEGIFQEVWLALTKFLKRQSPDNMAGLIMRITKGCIADYYRHADRTIRTKSSQAQEDELQLDPIDPNDSHQRWIDMEHCLHTLRKFQLTEEQQEAFIMHYGQRLTVGEIAEWLNLPFETVKSRIYLGKRKIKTYLEKQKRDMP